MNAVKYRVKGQIGLKRQLQTLTLSNTRRRWVHRSMGNKVRVYSRARIRAQRDLSGQRYEQRVDGRKKKMETGLGRKMGVFADSKQARVTWGNGLMAQIAYAQQHGIDELFTALKAEKVYGKSDYKAPATLKQARALREAGYTVKRGKHGKRKTPTLKWMIANLNRGKAGLILRILRQEQKKQRWTVGLPERSFLGTTRSEDSQLLDFLSDEILRLV